MSRRETWTAAAYWRCRAKRCDFVYVDPIGADAVGHRCPARDDAWTSCRRLNRKAAGK